MYKIPRFRPSLSSRAKITIIKSLLTVTAGNDRQRCSQFEENFAKYLGVRNAILVPSGRMGLFLILKQLGLKEKSQIILPAFTYWAVPKIISFLGLGPVFVDIDPKTCNMDASGIERKITPATKAILVTHLYGLPSPLGEIRTIAKKYNLLIIEDCVQSCGAEYKGAKVGSFGEAAYFGFGITKNLALLGGGMVVTQNDNLCKKIRQEVSAYGFLNRAQVLKKALAAFTLKVFTSPPLFSFLLFPLMRLFSGFKIDIAGKVFAEREDALSGLPEEYFKLIPSGLQGEMGLNQLPYLDELNNKRIKHAAFLLGNLQGLNGVTLPCLPAADTKNIFTNFPIRSRKRDFLAWGLLKRGIDSSSGYMKNQDRTCPNAQALEESILHIPVYPFLEERDLLYISETIKEIYKKMNL